MYIITQGQPATLRRILGSALLGLLVLGSCNNLLDSPAQNSGQDDDVVEQKILILQAYGSGDGDSNTNGAVSHNFVELYNPTDQDISLTGYSLQYGHVTKTGTAGNFTYNPEPWRKLDLAGTIRAKSSFLVLGHAQNTGARLQLSDTDADQIWYDDSSTNSGIIFDNRNFKICLVKSLAVISVANPFNTDGLGTRIPGYVDMFGGINSNKANDRDEIQGYEGPIVLPEDLPETISKQKAARRKNIIDTDNNAADFESIDYRLPPTGITDEQAEFYRPKRSAEGPWDPVYVAPPPVASPGSVLIFQVYGSGTATDGAVSHNFIELYNTTAAAINLAGYSVQYAEAGTSWEKLDLTGTIPAFGSFLILGSNNNTGGRLQLNVATEHTTADQTWAGRIIDNQKFKIVLMQSTDFLTVADPFTGGADGTPVAGYMDMIGAVNGGSEALDAYETAKANVISKQKAARRKNLTDTNNNAVDFESIDYRSSGITNEQIPLYRPRNTAAGSWDPASPPTERLMIFQVYGPGNSDDPDGVFTDGAISHSFIELYNNTAASINLSGYSIQYSEGGTAWTKLDLTGAVPAHSSFLILGENHNISPRLDLTGQADQAWSGLEISRKRFKIALLSNTTLLTAANPFTGGTGGGPVAGYIDMLGSGDNDGSIPIDVFETSGAMIPCPTLLSKQKSARRKNLTDTDNNLVDFESRDFRADRMTADALKIYRPKNTAYGVWDTVNPTD